MPPKNKKTRYVTRKKIGKKIGRPTVMTKATLGKLEAAFQMGSTDREASLYAKINPDTLYSYQREHTDFSEQKEAWKSRPLLAARKVIADNIQKGDLSTAKWYLERKASDEFGTSAKTVANNHQTSSIAELFDEDDE